MQRFNKSAHAPVGTAFFLFLGLAILPYSLKFAGVQISINPKLSAAVDAWQQITEVFGASSQTTVADLSINQQETVPEQTDECSANHESQLACAGDAESEFDTFSDVSESSLTNPICTRKPVTSHSRRTVRSEKPLASIVVAGEGTKYSAVNAIDALNFASLRRSELLKGASFQYKSELFKNIHLHINRNLPKSSDFKDLNLPDIKILVRSRQKASASSAASAQCKVYSALASERRRECDRASLTVAPFANPDHGEF